LFFFLQMETSLFKEFLYHSFSTTLFMKTFAHCANDESRPKVVREFSDNTFFFFQRFALICLGKSFFIFLQMGKKIKLKYECSKSDPL
jgi:hypothetical protein